MSKKQMFFAMVVLPILIYVTPVKADEIEMGLQVSHGVTEREYYIHDMDGTFTQCVFQAPIIATKFINENLPGIWLIRRITCGPPRRNM